MTNAQQFIVQPETEELARNVRDKAVRALGLLATAVLEIHEEVMADWLIDTPEVSQSYNPATGEFHVAHTLRKILPNGDTKSCKFHAIFDGDTLTNTSSEFFLTEKPTPQATAS